MQGVLGQVVVAGGAGEPVGRVRGRDAGGDDVAAAINRDRAAVREERAAGLRTSGTWRSAAGTMPVFIPVAEGFRRAVEMTGVIP